MFQSPTEYLELIPDFLPRAYKVTLDVSISYGVFRAYTDRPGPRHDGVRRVSISYGVFRAYTRQRTAGRDSLQRVSISYGVFRAYTAESRCSGRVTFMVFQSPTEYLELIPSAQ